MLPLNSRRFCSESSRKETASSLKCRSSEHHDPSSNLLITVQSGAVRKAAWDHGWGLPGLKSEVKGWGTAAFQVSSGRQSHEPGRGLTGDAEDSLMVTYMGISWVPEGQQKKQKFTDGDQRRSKGHQHQRLDFLWRQDRWFPHCGLGPGGPRGASSQRRGKAE